MQVCHLRTSTVSKDWRVLKICTKAENDRPEATLFEILTGHA